MHELGIVVPLFNGCHGSDDRPVVFVLRAGAPLEAFRDSEGIHGIGDHADADGGLEAVGAVFDDVGGGAAVPRLRLRRNL